MGESGKEDKASKLVQEIAQKEKEVPERYILKEGLIPQAIDANPTLWDETLLIDFSLLSSFDSSSSSTSAQQNELSKLQYALKHWGCFQMKNHGMTSLFLDELLQVSKQFFGLPLEEKLKCSIADDFLNRYGTAAPIAGDKSRDWNDRLFLTVHPHDQIKFQVWPEKPNKFREILLEYSLNLRKILEVLLKVMAQFLDLKDESFLNQHGKQGSILTRFSIYPRCSLPDRVYGVHPHSDRCTVTILLQDKDVVEGLHVEKDDKWFKVPVIPGALFINLGDFAEVMSNGLFKSAVHRVVTNSERERVSVAAFCIPEPGREIEPINELISPNQPQLYKPVNMQTYKQLFQTYPLGERLLDALKI